jgi:excisionase family DNA binding protein
MPIWAWSAPSRSSIDMTPTATRGRLTLGEVARRLGISPRSLSRLIAAGELPEVPLSARVVRIAPADLAAYIKAPPGEPLTLR